ncbi:Uncharacterised protein [uncultured archaeon]|nr:Uncharacterised protein [uncultured archaeon]
MKKIVEDNSKATDKNDNEKNLKLFKNARILLWAGGLYGILMGFFVAFGPLYEYRTSTGYQGYESLAQTQGFLFAFSIIAITLLLFGGTILLLLKKQYALIIVLLAVHAILEVLTLPSMGLLFIPATVLIFVATLILYQPGHRSKVETQIAGNKITPR